MKNDYGIDCNSLLHGLLCNSVLQYKGAYTNGIWFLNMFLKVLEDYSHHLQWLLTKGSTFRHLAYADYKGTRQKARGIVTPI